VRRWLKATIFSEAQYISVVRYHGTTAVPFFYGTSTIAFTDRNTTSTAVLQYVTCPFFDTQ